MRWSIAAAIGLGTGLGTPIQLSDGGTQSRAGLLVAGLCVFEDLHLLGLEVISELDEFLHVLAANFGEFVEPFGAFDSKFCAETLDLVGKIIALLDRETKLPFKFADIDGRLEWLRHRLGYRLGDIRSREEVTAANSQRLQDAGQLRRVRGALAPEDPGQRGPVDVSAAGEVAARDAAYIAQLAEPRGKGGVDACFLARGHNNAVKPGTV